RVFARCLCARSRCPPKGYMALVPRRAHHRNYLFRAKREMRNGLEHLGRGRETESKTILRELGDEEKAVGMARDELPHRAQTVIKLPNDVPRDGIEHIVHQ